MNMRPNLLVLTRDPVAYALLTWTAMEVRASPQSASPQSAFVGAAYVWTDPDYRALANTARSLHAPPVGLLEVGYSESRLNPAAKNPSGAYGVAQLTTASGIPRSTLEALLSMTPAQQMPYIEAAFKKWGHPSFEDGGALYAYTFLPSRARERGTRNDSVLTSYPESYYVANPGLDFDKDGHITVLDLRRHLAKLSREPAFQAHLANLNRVAPSTGLGTTTTPRKPSSANVASAGLGLLALGAVAFALSR